MNEDQFALLKVIEATMVDIKEDVKEIKNSLKSKVEHTDFHALKGEVEDLKKRNFYSSIPQRKSKSIKASEQKKQHLKC